MSISRLICKINTACKVQGRKTYIINYLIKN